MKIKTKIFIFLLMLNWLYLMMGMIAFELPWKPYGQIGFISLAAWVIGALINWLFFETETKK